MFGTFKKIALFSVAIAAFSVVAPEKASASSIGQIQKEADDYYFACVWAYQINQSPNNRSLVFWSYYLRLRTYNDLPYGRVDPCVLRDSYFFLSKSSGGLGVRTEEALDVVEAIEATYPCGPIL